MPGAMPGAMPDPVPVQHDAELVAFLNGCLDIRIVEKSLRALDAQEVFTIDDLSTFHRLPSFKEAFKPMTAEKIRRALESRFGPGATEEDGTSPGDRGPTDVANILKVGGYNSDEVDDTAIRKVSHSSDEADEPEWLAEASTRLSYSLPREETTVPSPPASTASGTAVPLSELVERRVLAPAVPPLSPTIMQWQAPSQAPTIHVHPVVHVNAPPTAPPPTAAPVPAPAPPTVQASPSPRDESSDAAAVARAALDLAAAIRAESEDSRASTNATMASLTRALSELAAVDRSPGLQQPLLAVGTAPASDESTAAVVSAPVPAAARSLEVVGGAPGAATTEAATTTTTTTTTKSAAAADEDAKADGRMREAAGAGEAAEPAWLMDARAELETPDWLDEAEKRLSFPQSDASRGDLSTGLPEPTSGPMVPPSAQQLSAAQLRARQELVQLGSVTHHHHYTQFGGPQWDVPIQKPSVHDNRSCTPMPSLFDAQRSWLFGQEQSSFSRRATEQTSFGPPTPPPRGRSSSKLIRTPTSAGSAASIDTLTVEVDPSAFSLDTLTAVTPPHSPAASDDEAASAPASGERRGRSTRARAKPTTSAAAHTPAGHEKLGEGAIIVPVTHYTPAAAEPLEPRASSADARLRRRWGRSKGRDSREDNDDDDDAAPMPVLDIWGQVLPPKPSGASRPDATRTTTDLAPIKRWLAKTWRFGYGVATFGFGGGDGNDDDDDDDERTASRADGYPLYGDSQITFERRSKSFDVHHRRKRMGSGGAAAASAAPAPRTPVQQPAAEFDAEMALWLDPEDIRAQNEALAARAAAVAEAAVTATAVAEAEAAEAVEAEAEEAAKAAQKQPPPPPPPPPPQVASHTVSPEAWAAQEPSAHEVWV